MPTLFDDRTNLGLVRFYAQETSSRLRAIFDSILAENRTTDLGAGFSKDATAALDELF